MNSFEKFTYSVRDFIKSLSEEEKIELFNKLKNIDAMFIKAFILTELTDDGLDWLINSIKNHQANEWRE